MRALVTGDRGFVGGYLVDLLVAEGLDVAGFDVRTDPPGDVRHYESVRGAVEDFMPDLVFHLAAQAFVAEGTTDPRRAIAVNVGGTLNLLEALRHTGCRARVLLAGTSEEYGYANTGGDSLTEDTATHPTTVYGVTKLAATGLGLAYARHHGLDVVVTRAFNHTGPGQSQAYAVSAFAKRVALAEAGLADAVRHGDLTARRNYGDVRDVVRAYRAAIDLPSGVYNVCADRTVTMGDVLDMLRAVATRTLITTEADPRLVRPAASDVDYHPSHQRLTDATGWHPVIPLERTLGDLLDWWRTRL